MHDLSLRRFAMASLAGLLVITLLLGVSPRHASAQGLVFPPVTYSAAKHIELQTGPVSVPASPTVTGVTYQVEYSDTEIADVSVDMSKHEYIIEPKSAAGTATVQVTWYDAMGHAAAEKFAVMVNDTPNGVSAPDVNVSYFRDLYLLTNENQEIDVDRLFPGNDQRHIKEEFRYTVDDTPDVYNHHLIVKPFVTYLTLQPKSTFDDATIRVSFTRNDGVKVSTFAKFALNQPPLFVDPLEAMQLLKHKDAILNLDQYYTDPNGDKLKYRIVQVDPALSVTPAIVGSQLVIPAGADQSFKIRIEADDSRMGTVEGEFSFQVNEISLQEYAGSYEDMVNVLSVSIKEKGTYVLAPYQEWLSQLQGQELRREVAPADAAAIRFTIDGSAGAEVPAGTYGIYKVDADIQVIAVIELQGKRVLEQELLSIATHNGRGHIELPDVREWILRKENQNYLRIRMAMSFL